MQVNNSTQVSSLGRALCVTWIALSTFAVGYTASRAILGQSGIDSESAEAEFVIPHQAVLWDAGLSQ